jgi:hypothetical protein
LIFLIVLASCGGNIRLSQTFDSFEINIENHTLVLSEYVDQPEGFIKKIPTEILNNKDSFFTSLQLDTLDSNQITEIRIKLY